MLKTIGILLAFIFVSVGIAKSGEDNCRLVYPREIPVNSSFDISLVTSNSDAGADRLEFYILPLNRISLNSIELQSLAEKKQLSFSPVQLEDYGTAYKCVINLKDSVLSQGVFFQILMNFKSESVLSSGVKFAGYFMKGNRILAKLSTSRSNLTADGDYITADLNFYKPMKSAGKSLLVGRNSSLQASLNNINPGNLLLTFWLKPSLPSTEFLKVYQKGTSDTLFSLGTNAFQMLSVKSKTAGDEYVSPYFISRKVWYNISADFSFDSKYAAFNCNGHLLLKSRLRKLVEPDNLIFNFGGKEYGKVFQLDLLRFIDLKNNIDASFTNRNYLNFNSDSSSVISQFAFDDREISASSEGNVVINPINLQYVKSDAPIFTRAPELNIVPLSGAYELDWSGGDYKQADHYVLQKSTGNSAYEDLTSINSENDGSKVYSYIDKRDNNSDVVYYRVKQVNGDGSTAYSSQVKVGQGDIEPFVAQQNYPNPFNPTTSITVDLLEDSDLEVTVYNMEGKEIQNLFKGHLAKGSYTFNFDATDLPSGVYLYKISTPNFSQMKKMIFTK